ncbi:hypothetical protein [Microvirga yunnanensis]|uniref:hypothetical protein n=1 Tax=Microvirga yunnanensis TaxID=2953740 RepID=UPI0021C95560|nr:hypothetical protein [Microvirga sp. HBU65207]
MAGEPAKGLYRSRWLARSLRGVAGRPRWKPTADGASASPAPVAVSVATSVSATMAIATIAVAASATVASPTTTSGIAVAAAWVGRIGALYIGTGVVGRLRSVAQAVVVAWPLTVSVPRSVAMTRPGTIAIAAGTCRPAAATATRRVSAKGSAR